jgi:hypothetical protein
MLSVLLMNATQNPYAAAAARQRAPREGEVEFYEALLPLQGLPDEPVQDEKKGGVGWLLRLVAPLLWLFVPVLLVAVAEVALAQATGSRALVQDPTGLLQGNAKAKDAVALLNWILLIAGAVPATIFTVYAGKKFNDQEYGAALGSAIGAVIAGLGGYIAFSFV